MKTINLRLVLFSMTMLLPLSAFAYMTGGRAPSAYHPQQYQQQQYHPQQYQQQQYHPQDYQQQNQQHYDQNQYQNDNRNWNNAYPYGGYEGGAVYPAYPVAPAYPVYPGYGGYLPNTNPFPDQAEQDSIYYQNQHRGQ